MFDEEGFLVDLDQWSEVLAENIASREGIVLTDAHWQLVHLARAYYQQFDLSPEMRPFIKWLVPYLGKDNAKSLYLLRLFPGSPTKLISKVAGLPKPANCI